MASVKNTDLFVFVDTNIFVQCCLLQNDGDDEKSIDTLLSILNTNKAKLLLPEVVKKEFFKRINDQAYNNWADDFKKSHNPIREQAAQSQDQRGKAPKSQFIKPDSTFSQKLELNCQDNFDKFLTEQVTSFKSTQAKVEKIFKHKNRISIPLLPEDFFNAYRLYLSGEKPIKNNAYAIQSDAVIMTGLYRFLNKQKNYKFIICSSNCQDFAADNITLVKGTEENVPLHPDILSNIKGECELYVFLSVLLEKVFGAKLKTIKDKTEETIVVSTSDESELVGLSK